MNLNHSHTRARARTHTAVMTTYYVGKSAIGGTDMVNNKGRIYTQRTPDYGNRRTPNAVEALKAAHRSDATRVDNSNKSNQK